MDKMPPMLAMKVALLQIFRSIIVLNIDTSVLALIFLHMEDSTFYNCLFHFSWFQEHCA